jgi:hypothetical protein
LVSDKTTRGIKKDVLKEKNRRFAMEEKRKAVRWNIVLPVRYLGISTHREGTAKTRDLSTIGARLEMVEKHKPGDRLEIMLEIPDSNNGSVCAEADVVWQQGSLQLGEECNYLTGLVFRKIRDCHKQCILDYVVDNRPQQIRQRWWDGV